MMRLAILMGAAVLLSACASTGGERPATAAASAPSATAPAPAQRIGSVAEFLEAQRNLRTDVEDGKFGRFTDNDMDLFITSQQTLFRILGEVTTVDELDRDQRVAVYNAQETIHAILTDSIDSRPICRREHTVGTHRRVVTCFTVAERRRMSESARDIWEWANRSSLAPPE